MESGNNSIFGLIYPFIYTGAVSWIGSSWMGSNLLEIIRQTSWTWKTEAVCELWQVRIYATPQKRGLGRAELEKGTRVSDLFPLRTNPFTQILCLSFFSFELVTLLPPEHMRSDMHRQGATTWRPTSLCSKIWSGATKYALWEKCKSNRLDDSYTSNKIIK